MDKSFIMAIFSFWTHYKVMTSALLVVENDWSKFEIDMTKAFWKTLT